MPPGERQHVFLYSSLANKYSLASQQLVLKVFRLQCRGLSAYQECVKLDLKSSSANY